MWGRHRLRAAQVPKSAVPSPRTWSSCRATTAAVVSRRKALRLKAAVQLYVTTSMLGRGRSAVFVLVLEAQLGDIGLARFPGEGAKGGAPGSSPLAARMKARRVEFSPESDWAPRMSSSASSSCSMAWSSKSTPEFAEGEAAV